MQSYLYKNEDRIREVYAQYAGGLPVKKIVEKHQAAEGGIAGGIPGIFKPTLKGTKGHKSVVETIDTPENMVAVLIGTAKNEGFTKQIMDWNLIVAGDLIVFDIRINVKISRLGNREVPASYNGEVLSDLRLAGLINNREVEIIFSTEHFTGWSQVNMILERPITSIQGLAVVMNKTENEPVIFQPLAFGNGFL
ncbi:MAG: hypothetical protein GY781_07410 [Gammaproteobacteria bacterium]|nr:hypothetical protein [Gammaproteobacteria bacterium]